MDLGDGIMVIGGGPVGLVCAMLLAREGCDVHVFEGREDPRQVSVRGGRSIALTLAQRGWTALRAAGAEDRIRSISVPLRGRMIHLESGETRYQPYGAHGEAIDCVSRQRLTKALLDEVGARPHIHLHFGWRCVGVVPEDGVATFQEPGGTTNVVHCRRILAADGANSTVRTGLLNREDFELRQNYCVHFYKELNVPRGSDGSWPLEPNALHVWPRTDCMLAGFADAGRGFTCTLFLPMLGERSFNALSQPQELKTFFERTFADLTPLIPNLMRDFYHGAPSPLVSLQCYPWVFAGLALMGDAAHAMFPFLGQGLNAGLEDSCALLQCLTEGGSSWEEGLERYETLRKPQCDAVTEMAAQHYSELADATRDEGFLLRKQLEVRLGELLPEELASPYHIVSFSNRSYLEARRIGALQRRVVERVLARGGLEHGLDSERADGELMSLARAVLGRGSEGYEPIAGE